MPTLCFKFICIFIQTLALCILPSLALGQSTQKKTLEQIIDQKISNLSLEQKVGQLFIVGFPQTKIDRDLMQFLHTYKPGAFILFKRNINSIDQIKELNTHLYSLSYRYSDLPPLIAVDQEGGAVSRLPIHPPLPTAKALGKTESSELAYRMGLETGKFLREVGFNINLAPVLDITPSSDSFIGLRSLGGDPKIVAEMGAEYSNGLQESRVLPTAKHFPGTGSVSEDPHDKIVVSPTNLQQFQEKHLVPFKDFISLERSKTIMLSHLLYPALDKDNPGTFSKKIISILREDLGFKDLIITDDLQMQSSKSLAGNINPAVKALIAGADLVMMSWSLKEQQRAFLDVQKAIQDGRIPEAELNAKLQRVLKAKAFTNLYRRPNDLPSLAFNGQLQSPSYQKLEEDILSENLRPYLIPQYLPKKVSGSRAPASNGPVCLMSASAAFTTSFKAGYSLSQSLKIFSNLETAKAAIEGCLVTVAVVNNRKQSLWLRSLNRSLRKNILVVNQTHPSFVSGSGYYKKINLYFEHQESGKKIAQHLSDLLRDLNIHLAKN